MPEFITIDDGFGVSELTAAINVQENKYGLMESMNLFPEKGVYTRTISIEEKNGVLTILPTAPLGGPPTVTTSGGRQIRSFVIPHVPHEGVLLPEEYANVRAFGTAAPMAGVSEVINDKLAEYKAKLAITLEYHRCGALAGEILDADGSVIYNLFTESGVAEFDQDFKFSVAGTDIPAACRSVRRHIKKSLKGEIMTGVVGIADADFMDKLRAHPTVKEWFVNHPGAVAYGQADEDDAIFIGGIKFIEYVGESANAAGVAKPFIAADTCRFAPIGTGAMSTSVAPGDFTETIGTKGKLMYAKMVERKFNRGYDIHVQMNALPWCNRPAVLAKGSCS
jgi:hypothetical protein